MKQELFTATKRKNLLTKRECRRELTRTSRVNVISSAQITLDFIEFLQIFLKITGETLFLSSVLSLELRINLAFAAKMHGCQGKNSAKTQEI